MLTCYDIADYFLSLVDQEAGDTMTQLKLQKLMYFAQGISLALRDTPLFENTIEAWEHGPVVRDLYKKFAPSKKNTIPAPSDIDFNRYPIEVKELIYKVYSEYGEHTASYLRHLTHTHSIWKTALHCYDPTISMEDMKSFFKRFIKKDFLKLTPEDQEKIAIAEDNWWMNYDSGVPSTNIRDELVCN